MARGRVTGVDTSAAAGLDEVAIEQRGEAERLRGSSPVRNAVFVVKLTFFAVAEESRCDLLTVIISGDIRLSPGPGPLFALQAA